MKPINCYIFILVMFCSTSLYAQLPAASEWSGALAKSGEVYKATLTFWNKAGSITGVIDYLEQQNYNNPLTATRKGDSLVIVRYSKKDPSKIALSMRGVITGNLYSGTYTSGASQQVGAFAFSQNEGGLVRQQPVPGMSFASLENNGDMIKLDNHKGKYLLVDFWATYCATCIPKRKELDSVYAKFKNDLAIISVSLDKDAGSVETFRKEKFSMPWQHACVAGNFEAEICKLFGVDKIGTPAIFLVSPDGVLLAKTSELLGVGIDNVMTMYTGRK